MGEGRGDWMQISCPSCGDHENIHCSPLREEEEREKVPVSPHSGIVE